MRLAHLFIFFFIFFFLFAVPSELTDSGKAIEYTDCCEISLLRFTHAVALDMNSAILNQQPKIDFARLDQLGAADWLRKFFNDHPFVGDRAYFSTTDEGQAERNEWSVLLTRQPPPFVYARQGKFELEANICNFFAMLKVCV